MQDEIEKKTTFNISTNFRRSPEEWFTDVIGLQRYQMYLFLLFQLIFME